MVALTIALALALALAITIVIVMVASAIRAIVIVMIASAIRAIVVMVASAGAHRCRGGHLGNTHAGWGAGGTLRMGCGCLGRYNCCSSKDEDAHYRDHLELMLRQPLEQTTYLHSFFLSSIVPWKRVRPYSRLWIGAGGRSLSQEQVAFPGRMVTAFPTSVYPMGKNDAESIYVY